MKPALIYTILILSLVFSGCRNTGNKDSNSQSPPRPENVPGDNNQNATSNPKLKSQVHAFKIVSVNNNLKFAILQNVTGLVPPLGEQLEVFRGSEFVGLVVAGDQSDETFLSADIIEGKLKQDDLAFLIVSERPEPATVN